MSSPAIRALDAEISQHYAAIDRHRLEIDSHRLDIMRLQEARDTLGEVLARQSGHEYRTENGAALSRPGGKFQLVVERMRDDEPGHEEPAAIAHANGEDHSSNGTTKMRKRRKPNAISEAVSQWFRKNRQRVVTTGDLIEMFGADTKAKKQLVYQRLHSLTKDGKIRRESMGIYSAVR